MDGGRMGVMLRVSQCLVEEVVEGVFVDCIEKTLTILLECVVELGNSGNMNFGNKALNGEIMGNRAFVSETVWETAGNMALIDVSGMECHLGVSFEVGGFL
jgi:hypothetical protein